MSKVSIGLPVYNGERFLKVKLDSILQQTHTNFELIISDNASTDKTENICIEYKNKDNRIKYFRQEKNFGVTLNFEFVLKKSNGDYFMWTGVDDILLPKFIEKNVQNLENNKECVASISKINSYQPDDENIQINKNDIEYSKIIKNIRNYVRPRSIVPINGNFQTKTRTYLKKSSCQVIYSIFKSEIIKKSIITEPFLGNDWAIFLNVLKYGNLAVINEILMYEYERGISGKGLISSTKQFNKGIGVIFPWYSLTKWCIKNLGVKFYIKNMDYFVQLNLEGGFSIIINVFHIMKRRIKIE
jgi:glycosyltransferase involved in cell wall biosynthesis